MSSKNKESLSEADVAYKEELDSLVLDLLNTDLSSVESETMLLKLVDHATNDFGSISTIPKSLQFLIPHKAALDEYYNRYAVKNADDTYSLVLLLELVSFLEAINLSEAPKKDGNEGSKKEEHEKVETPSFKLMLYKLEANLVAARLLASGDSTSTPVTNEVVMNGLYKDTVEFSDQKSSKYKLTEKTRKLLAERKVSDWGNEYLISLSSQIVAYYSLPSTRQQYTTYLDTHKDPGKEKFGAKPTVVLENNVNLVIVESLKLIEEMTTYWLANGFEFDAIDLLLEVDRIESIADKCSDDYDLVTRVSSYLASISYYGATFNETNRILQVTYNLLMKNSRYVEAARVALKLNDYPKVMDVLRSCKDLNVLKQLSLMLNTNHLYLSTLSSLSRDAVDSSRMNEDEPEFEETVVYLNSGENRSSLFLTLCRELDVMDPKHPNEVFKGYPSKSNLSLTQTLSGISIDSARDNLSYTFVNAFINCGTSTEKLMNPESTVNTPTDGNSSTGSTSSASKDMWLFKHQGYGLLCASASLGLIHLWNLDEGLSEIDKYQYSTDQYVRAGAYVAFGLVSCGVVSEVDPIQGLLTDKLDSGNFLDRLGSILGLAFAYGGTNRQDLLEMLIPMVVDLSTMECSLFSSLALSVIFVGTGNQESTEAVLQALMEYISSCATDELDKEGAESSTEPNVKFVRLYLCSLGLLQLCRGELCEPLLEALKVLGKYEKIATTVVESFAYTTSGDVLKIQTLLKNLVAPHTDVVGGATTSSDAQPKDENLMDLDAVPNPEAAAQGAPKTDKPEKTDKADKSEAPDEDKLDIELYGLSVLCIAVISLGENIGSSMLVRLMEHPLQCGSIHERRAVPLAIALVNISNPAPQIVSVLSKLTHDSDKEVCLQAIFALGLVGAGTNNSRISQILQSIAKHSYRDSVLMYVLRVSVGLLFMGKGTLTLSPLHSEGFLLNKVSLAGLLVVLFSCLDLRTLVCEEFPFLVLFLSLAIRPKWLITLNQDLEVVNIPVRVGSSVDTIGTAGKQRRVSGFQTHKSPVLIGVGERAELATEDYESFTPFLEDIVLISST